MVDELEMSEFQKSIISNFARSSFSVDMYKNDDLFNKIYKIDSFNVKTKSGNFLIRFTAFDHFKSYRFQVENDIDEMSVVILLTQNAEKIVLIF